MVKESPYISALVLSLALTLAGCNPDSTPPVEERELSYPEIPLRTQERSAFNIIDHSPIDGKAAQSLQREVLVTFDTALLSQTVTRANVQLLRAGKPVPSTVVYVADTRTVRIVPSQSLQPDSRYRVVLSDRLMSATGETYVGVEWAFATAGPIGDTSQSTLDTCMSTQAISMLEAVNRRRQSGQVCDGERLAPVPALSYQCTLQNVAQGHAEDLAEQSLLSHLSSDGRGLSARVEDEAYNWQSLGENLAVTSRADIEEPIQPWLDSESNCRNLMDPEFSQIGIGRAQSSDGVHYWVQNLAKPAPGY